MVKQAAKAGATGGGVGGVASSSCDIGGGMDLDGLLVLVVLAAVVGVVWFGGKLIADAIRRRKHRLLANAAAQKLLPSGFSTGRIGTIVEGLMLPTPIDNTPGVAYAITLTQRGRTMLYDGATLGFEVLLADNSRVVIPAGTCMIDLVDAAKLDATSYLLLTDRLRNAVEDFDPFIHDRCVGRTLAIGDEVEVLGRLVEKASGGGGGYREARETVLVPVGVPALRVR